MEKTKKNGILKTAACIFGGTMLMTCVLGGTLAKYTSTAESVDAQVKVAKWEVKAEAEKTETKKSVKWTVGRNTGYTGTLVTDKTDNDNGIACPGTWGYAKVNLVNTGEVTADITVGDADATLDSGNIKYYVGTNEGTPTYESLKSSGLTSIEEPIKLAAGKSEEIYIAYVWEYDDADSLGTNDEADTLLQGTELDALSGDMTLTIVQSKDSSSDTFERSE